MSINCGIIGLPNVGKSTLFNAITEKQSAEVANYPFCTIEPNVGRVGVPDTRLDSLAKIAQSAKTIYAQMEFVDIAGLVKGASKGEGLGNQFLGNIRQVDAVCHVVRCFDDDDITHVAGSVDPVRDAEIINTELALADYDSLAKRRDSLGKRAKGGDTAVKNELNIIEKILPTLDMGKPIRQMPFTRDEKLQLQALHLLTDKPVLYVCNLPEGDCVKGNDYSRAVEQMAKAEGAGIVFVSAAIEAELIGLAPNERTEYLNDLGLGESGLNRVIAQSYKLLGMLTYFTVGPKEARAWAIPKGYTAQEAAGVIHTDFARGFIAGERVHYTDYIACGGETKAKELGKLTIEGRDYIVQDGDIFHFRFNV